MPQFQRVSSFLITVFVIIFHARIIHPWTSLHHLHHCDQPKRSSRTNANVVLGGLFPVHALNNVVEKRFFDLNLYAVTWVEAMIFAVEEINNSSKLLDHFSLGFDIRDTCNEVPRALKETLEFVLDVPRVNRSTSSESTSLNYWFSNSTEQKDIFCECMNKTPAVSAVIGGAASPISTKVSTILGVDNIPQISYSSTSALLSDKQSYPSFLRTIPSDLYQAKAIADLLLAFRWNYVSIVASDNAYGRSGMEALRIELKVRRICTAVEAIFHPSLVKEELNRIIDSLKRKPRASVVVLWCQRPNAVGFLQEVTKQGLKGKTWIGTETWGDAYQIKELNPDTVGGMIGIVPHLQKYDAFEKHLAMLNPQNSAHNPWMKEYWEKEFACSWQTNKSLKALKSKVLKERYYMYSYLSQPHLSHTEEYVTVLCPKDKGLPNAFRLPRNKYTNVMDAVYAVAYGVENILKCKEGNGLLKDAKCPQIKPFIKPNELLVYIRNVSFAGRSGNRVMFTSSGDPVYGSYAIKNLQNDHETVKMDFVEVGIWSGNTKRLDLFANTSIQWNSHSNAPPNSTCEDICPPGKYVVNGTISCCWTCVPCVRGFAKHLRGLFPCIRCPVGYDSNIEGTSCIKLREDYLHFKSSMGVAITVFCCIGILVTGFVIVVFIKNRKAPLVKASNRDLSYIHLTTILVIFTFPFSVIGKPTAASCVISPFYFSVPFSLCTSITLLKTNRLLRIFQSRTRLTNSRSNLLTNKVQLVRAVALSAVPVTMATVWVIIKPPIVEVITKEITEKRLIYQCSESIDALHITLLVFILFLALVCTYFAYKARKLPENFNEAKFIGFAMFGFCLCWLAFIPTYYDTKGANKSFIFATTVILSGFCVLGIMYFPKLRIMFCFPEENRPEVFRTKIILSNTRPSPRASPVISHKLFTRSSPVLRGSPTLGMERTQMGSQSAVSLGSFTVFN